MLPEALSDDSIVQPRPEEEEKQTSPKSPREVLKVSVLFATILLAKGLIKRIIKDCFFTSKSTLN